MTLAATLRVEARDVDVALDLADGETLALLGPNGAGKSTVLSVVAGLVRPDRGSVVLDGRRLTAVDGGEPAWVPPHDRKVALLAQDPLLFPHLTARENVAFGPRSRGVGHRAARESARRWLLEVGAEELADRRPDGLSGGQAQRVAVARALAAEPRLLLLDEPLAALDVGVAAEVRQTLKRVLRGRSAVLVTHDVLDALLLADRVVVLDGGRVVEEGPAGVVLARPRSAFAAQIAGLDLVRGTWRDGSLVSPDGRRVDGVPHEPLPREGDPVCAVFRPNAVAVYRTSPGGSPRNTFAVVVTDLEPHAGHFRVRAGDLAADVTPAAVADLDLVPGARVLFTVKATEVAIYAG